MPPILSCLTSPLTDSTHVSYQLRFIRHQFPSHVFASHHLRSCSALPCSCLEPSALGVRPALFTTIQQKPGISVARFQSSRILSRLSCLLARVSPPFHYGETLRSLLLPSLQSPVSLSSVSSFAFHSGKNQKTYEAPCPKQNQSLKKSHKHYQ